MPVDPKSPAGGGCLILIGFVAGAGIGIARGEPSLGAILGVAGGIVAAVVIWLIGRAKDAR